MFNIRRILTLIHKLLKQGVNQNMAYIPGVQPDIKYCPAYKGELRNIPRSEMKSKGYRRKDGTVSEHTIHMNAKFAELDLK